jgi:D-alanyl-D-alanine carboxypeptidase/D-alanyl-D-alanine-endopeptidase (penicillin-binding protein 4)
MARRWWWRNALGAVGVLGMLASGAAGAEPPLQGLALEHVGAGQGVYVEAEDGTVLAAEAAARAVHPASVTKVATTLALLERLGPDHRFTTRVLGTGRVADGRLAGDLVIEGGNDPFFVSESALLALRRLRAEGVTAVGGGLRVRGPFVFNWKPDPEGVATAKVLGGSEPQAWAALGGVEPAAHWALRFARRHDPGASDAATLLATYRSPPLLHVVKTCNGYSNNVFHFASDTIGGPHAVEEAMRAHLPADQHGEIRIDNGAGGGTTNRLSPRAAVVVLRALDRYLHGIGRDLTATLPVSAVDPGTLRERLLDRPRIVVGKTGTFGSVGASALSGALRTRRWGVVYFAVLNRDVPVPAARARQDAFVRALADAAEAEPWPYATPERPTYTLATVE